MNNPPFGSPRVPRGPVGNPLFESPPRQQSRNPRSAATQPTYDFLAGPSAASSPGPAHAHPQSQLRKSMVVSGGTNKPPNSSNIDISNEGLRSEVNALRYELSTIKADREMERVRHQEEIRALQAKVEDKARLADAAETDKRFLFEKQTGLAEELKGVKDAAENQQHSHERTIRQLKAQVAQLEETADERLEDFRTLERQTKRQIDELETRNRTLNSSSELLQKEYDENMASFQESQQRCSAQEVEIENLRTEVVQLKGANGDLETLQVIKRELSEQLAHIKSLETTNKKLTEEVKILREVGKKTEILEEQKASLEGKLRMMESLREELSEKELQISIMKDEKKAWSAFLEDNEGCLKGFNSPQDIARALMEEKVEKADLVERLGRVEPELAEREEAIERAEKEREEVRGELEKVVESYKKLHASRARIERNRQLALKEVGMLRDQLKSYSTEESNLMGGNYDEHKTKLIEQLEALTETYKRENESLLTDLSKKEQELSANPSKPPDSLKRAHDAISSSETTLPGTTIAEETSEKLGQLTRRARHYQDEVTRLKKSESLLKKELKAAQSRLSSLEKSTAERVRILQLKDNPTARHEAVKLSQLRTLQDENAALMAQVRGRMHEVGKLVSVSSLDAVTHQLDELKQQVAEKEKRMARLKQIWSQKSVEWRQAVHSIVGILFDFMPNGRVRVSSKEWYDDGQGGGGAEDPGIIFDGEQGTMKVSPEGFSQKIRPLVKEWAEERGDIPGLIAALNMGAHHAGGSDRRMDE